MSTVLHTAECSLTRRRATVWVFLSLLSAVTTGRSESNRSFWCPHATLRESLHGLIRSTVRPIQVFHGAGRERVGLIDTQSTHSNDPRALEFLAAKVERFWSDDQPKQEGVLVSGLYAATDPVIARGFGAPGDEWVLLVIEIAPATRLLDLRLPRGEASRFELPESMQSELRQAGCEVRFPLMLFTSPQPSCMSIARQLIRDLTIDALIVPLPRAPLAGCADRPEGELLLVSTKLLARANIFLLERRPPKDQRGLLERSLVNGIFAQAYAAGSHQTKPWPLNGRELPSERIVSWMRQYLLGCGERSEDLEPVADCR